MVISASELAGLLVRRLAEHRERATLIVTQGQMPGWPEYREQVGYLTALREVAEFLDDITRNKGEF